MDVYIVAGGHSVGKSSVIRYIGIGKIRAKDIDNIYQLQINNVPKDVYCKSQSLQEAGNGITPANFIANINNRMSKANIDAILIALRTDKYNNMPEAIDYIKAFENGGWQIKGVIELVGCLRRHCKKKQYQYQSFQPISPITQVCIHVKKIFGF